MHSGLVIPTEGQSVVITPPLPVCVAGLPTTPPEDTCRDGLPTMDEGDVIIVLYQTNSGFRKLVMSQAEPLGSM